MTILQYDIRHKVNLNIKTKHDHVAKSLSLSLVVKYKHEGILYDMRQSKSG